jgi:flagellar basal-body rod protein FlgF/flagellar basal-body rod protein FlgG
MQNAMLIGLSRQISLERELEVVANNIANINSTGYKADGSIFEEFLMPVAHARESERQRLSYVQDRTTWHNFSAGPLHETGNPLDVAVDGDAFFVVQTARGERYTRNGSFKINAQGELVTSNGDRVLGEGGPIQFQTTDNGISINPDGTITVRENGVSTTDSARGKLRLARFDRVQQLQKDGSSLFAAPNGVNPLPPSGATRVIQGSLEQSNVQSVLEMARMVEVTRTYTQIASLLQQSSDMRRNAIDKLAEVPA